MWLRLRLDIGWRDLCRGLVGSLTPATGTTVQDELESVWSDGRNDTLATLCVRSGFDLFLQALELPSGDEVLFSAVTIRDMPRIAEAHGLIPVPVDVCGNDYHLDVESLRNRVTSRSRVLVVAHLFGARPDMREVLEIAREYNLFVVEDCAQAWCGPGWRGAEQADASLFSFGTIKTATALGGALCRVGDPEILSRMRAIQLQEPVQAGRGLPLRYCKFALLKLISTRFVFGWLAVLGRKLGRSVDDILAGLTRGFSADGLLPQLRHQPPPATLKLLLHRLKTHDPRRVQRRIANARRMIATLELSKTQPELLDPQHTFWLFPLLTDRAEDLIKHLRAEGFDSTQRGSMEVVPSPSDREDTACPCATELLNRTVFLPCYPEMSDRAIDEMCRLISDSSLLPSDTAHCEPSTVTT